MVDGFILLLYTNGLLLLCILGCIIEKAVLIWLPMLRQKSKRLGLRLEKALARRYGQRVPTQTGRNIRVK